LGVAHGAAVIAYELSPAEIDTQGTPVKIRPEAGPADGLTVSRLGAAVFLSSRPARDSVAAEGDHVLEEQQV
jgi:hypothetical protein